MKIMPTVSKKEAAIRQMDAAIKLFFEGGDKLAVFNLSSDVFMITENFSARVSHRYDDRNTILEYLQQFTDKEEFAIFKKAMGEKPNFLKHANRESDAEINDVTELEALSVLMMASENIRAVFGEDSSAMQAIRAYFLIFVPDNRFERAGISKTAIEGIKSFRKYQKEFGDKALKDFFYEIFLKSINFRIETDTTIGRILTNRENYKI